MTRNVPCFMVKKLTLLLMTVLVISAYPVQAREGVVRVGVYTNPPIVFPDDSGGYRGFSVEMLQHIAAKEDWDLEYVPGSFAECLKRLERGDLDLQVYIAYSKERGRKFDFNQETLLSNWGVVYTWPGSGIETLLDLEGRRVALMRESIHPQAFLDLINSFGVNVEIVDIVDHLDGMKLVGEKKVDAIVVNRVFGLANSRNFAVERTNIIFNPIEIRYAAPKGKNGDLLASIDTHLKALKADKASIFYQSFNRAFDIGSSVESLPKWVVPGVFFLCLLVAILFLLNHVLNKRVRLKTSELRTEIAERKQAEQLLSEGKTQLRTLLKTIPDLVWLKDVHGIYLFCNPRFECLYGAAEKEIIGKSDYDFVDREVADLFRHHDKRAMAAGKPTVNEEKLTFQDDGHQELVETIKTPIYGENGELAGVLGIARDITERQRSEDERQNLENRLGQAQKMEAIGTLAGGIAHDFNNILSTIFGYTEMAKEDAPPGTQFQKDLEQVLIGANRAKDLVKQILAFSRQSQVERIPVQIQPLIKEGLKLLRSSIPTTISITAEIDPLVGMVLADTTQIHQILMNLCTNAYQAMAVGGGTLSVAVKATRIGPDEPADRLPVTPGEYMQLTVADTGQGIGPDVIGRIFDPYFTTKGIGKGTGMGLAIIHGIISDYGGTITVASQLGKGTTFDVYLPVLAGDAVAVMPEPEAVPMGIERILFIDDEELLAEMGKEMLERLGYHVTVCTNSFEALATFRNTPHDFDVVITDQTMPGLTGSELARMMLQIRPGLAIILCTGYSNLINEDSAKMLGIKEFVLKPLTKGVIAGLLRKVLDGP